MSTPEPIVEEVDNTDLDAFNDLFHGKSEKAPEDDGPKNDTVEDDENNDAPIEHEETQEDDEDDADLAPEEEEEAPKPKTRTEKRIEQLLEKARLAEERAAALEAKLNERKEPETPKPTSLKSDNKAPHFDDKNEDGTDKYPLGQFDPSFQEDHIKFILAESLAEQKAQLEQEAKEKEARQAQEMLTNAWNEKLEPAKERYPDFQEKGEELLDTFSGIPQEYGEYLTATIMSLDNGPDVLYFLAENIDEAERIVRLGFTGAAVALGKIDARFEANADVEEKPKPRPKVSKAPTPPPRNKGSNAAVPEVADDTDDLEAFSAKLFKKG